MLHPGVVLLQRFDYRFEAGKGSLADELPRWIEISVTAGIQADECALLAALVHRLPRDIQMIRNVLGG